MISLQQVSKRYGDSAALTATDLDIERGRTTVLIGPSGCGKSTLLRLIAGLVEPDDGAVVVEGEALGRDNLRRWRHRMGYVIQEGGLFPHMTVAQNVTIVARHLRHDVSVTAARLQELAQLVQLPETLLTRYPAELSGGQRQRVSLMRALMLDPDVLLLDEPLGALDPMIRYQLQQDLKAIFKRLHKTAVMVTHDLAEAAYFADKVVLMRDGAIVQQGALNALVQAPADPFVEAFINAQRDPLNAFNEALA